MSQRTCTIVLGRILMLLSIWACLNLLLNPTKDGHHGKLNLEDTNLATAQSVLQILS